jgi:formylglycine-generating enzyme required for sulfatase activity
MGSPLEVGGKRAETPHAVQITKGFWLGKYEVTQAQWQRVMGSNPSCCTNAGENAPVEQVSWEDCQQFIAEVNSRTTGGKFRLPTEAEWEYACRAGTETALNSGKDLAPGIGLSCVNTDEVAWYVENADGTSHPVGRKRANAWGLYDMHGNVSEWCQDWYGEYPRKVAQDPGGPLQGFDRVFRGGSLTACPDYCRAADRDAAPPSHRSGDVGFRLARDE